MPQIPEFKDFQPVRRYMETTKGLQELAAGQQELDRAPLKQRSDENALKLQDLALKKGDYEQDREQRQDLARAALWVSMQPTPEAQEQGWEHLSSVYNQQGLTLPVFSKDPSFLKGFAMLGNDATMKAGAEMIQQQRSQQALSEMSQNLTGQERQIYETMLRSDPTGERASKFLSTIYEEKGKATRDLSSGQGRETFSVAPFLLTDKNGKLVPSQFSNRGGMTPVALPEGMRVAEGVSLVDVGNQKLAVGKKTGGVVSEFDKYLSPETLAKPSIASQVKKAELMAEKEVAASRLIPLADERISTIDHLINMPGLKEAVGLKLHDALIFSGSPGADYIAAIEQVKSGSFMDGIQFMKGFGSLSNAEGLKVESMVTSLSRNQSEVEHIRELRKIKQGVLNLRKAMEKDLEGYKSGEIQFEKQEIPDRTHRSQSSSLKTKSGFSVEITD